MFSKINLYVFNQIIKSCTLIFFIFLSISWLLQLTRLFTLTNLIQIDIISVIYLSLFLIPNLLNIIIPFIIIFGILLCFLKLFRDKEIIAIFSLGLQLRPIKNSLIFFGLFIFIFHLVLNFYLSPIIYVKYKLKEFELRNTINFDKMVISNFTQLNKNTTIDFKKVENIYEDIFISFYDDNENIIFAKTGLLRNEIDKYIFQLNDGFKITINKNNNLEKLEFENYNLKIKNENNIEFSNYDINMLTIFDDINDKNFINIAFKIFEIIIPILIIYFFYANNILNVNFSLKNNIYFIIISSFILISNQFLKNSGINIYYYLTFIFIISSITILLTSFKKRQ